MNNTFSKTARRRIIYGPLERAVLAASDATDWVSLSAIGRSRIVSLTIIIPFVGYLLLFNDFVFDYLRFAKRVLIDSGLTGDIIDAQDSFSLNNLYLLYFGLLFIGLASSLFAIFCPEEIKQHKLANDYIKTEEETKSKTVLISDLNYILEKYLNANQEMALDSSASVKRTIWSKCEYTDEIDQLHYNLIYEIFGKTDGLDDTEDSPEQEADHTDDGHPMDSLIYGNGYLNIYGISELVYMNRRVTFALTFSFRAAAEEFYKDILFIKFSCLRVSKCLVRLMVGALYGVGFLFLLIPTARTSLVVLLSMFG